MNKADATIDGALAEGPREVRVFLGCSRELAEERATFKEVIEELSRRHDIARSYRLVPVLWDQDGFGVGEGEINQTIQQSIDFEHLDIVVIAVWNEVGGGTEGEYLEALKLLRLRRRPQVLVLARDPLPGTDEARLLSVETFKERVIEDGGVPNAYSTTTEFVQKLKAQLPQLLPPPRRSDPQPFESLRRTFVVGSLVASAMSIATLYTASSMSAPYWGVTYARVLAILFLPPLVAIAFFLNAWTYHRLLAKLVEIWRSPDWDDARLYGGFNTCVPSAFIPQALRVRFPSAVGSQLMVGFVLLLAMAIPILAQYQALFSEILHWEYVLGGEVVRDEAGAAVVTGTGQRATVQSLYVDRTSRTGLSFGLRDAEVARLKSERPKEVLFVHAHGAFLRDQHVDPNHLFRRNRGPEIFLPWQPRIYFALLLASASLALWTLCRLVYLRRELSS